MRISDWSSDVCSSDLSSISASSIACITLRTISRSASGSCASNSLTADTAGLISVLVMACLLGDVEHHQPAMTASLLKRFCRTSRTLPLLGEGLSDCKRPLHSQGVLVASGPHARRNGGELSAARCQYSSRIRKLPAGLPPGWGAHASFKKWTSRDRKSTRLNSSH